MQTIRYLFYADNGRIIIFRPYTKYHMQTIDYILYADLVDPEP